MDAAPRYCGIAVIAVIVLSSFGLQRVAIDPLLQPELRAHRVMEMYTVGARADDHRREAMHQPALEVAH